MILLHCATHCFSDHGWKSKTNVAEGRLCSNCHLASGYLSDLYEVCTLWLLFLAAQVGGCSKTTLIAVGLKTKIEAIKVFIPIVDFI